VNILQLITRIIYYTIKINELSEIGLKNNIVPKSMLQPREIQKAKFMTFEEAEEKVFWRQKNILSFIEKNQHIAA
jgi:hypothetical protein